MTCAERWCFCRDDDGHTFLVPLYERERFNRDMQIAYGTESWDIVQWCQEYRCDNPQEYSFEDPKVIK